MSAGNVQGKAMGKVQYEVQPGVRGLSQGKVQREVQHHVPAPP